MIKSQNRRHIGVFGNLCWLILWSSLLGATNPLHAGEAGSAQKSALTLRIDPAQWSPPERSPEERELFKGEEYKERLAAALGSIDKAGLEKSKRPVWQVEITSIDEGSQAERGGIRVGDFLLELDGKRVWDAGQLNKMRTQGTQKLTVQTPAGERRTIDVEPGRIGFNTSNAWRPELLYVRGAQRDRRWEDAMLVAATLVKSDPALAETALHHALAAGFPPGYLSNALGAELAYRQGRYAEALDFSWLAMQAKPAPEAMPMFNRAFVSATALYKYERAVQLFKQNDPSLSEEGVEQWLQAKIAEHRALSQAEREAPAPTEAARTLGRIDLLGQAKALNQICERNVQMARGSGRMFLSVPSSHFIPVVFGPPAQNIEMEATFTAKATDKNPTEYARVFFVGFLNRDADVFEEVSTDGSLRALFGVAFFANEQITTYHGGKVALNRNFELSSLRLDGIKQNTLRLIVCGGRCEAFLNGQRILYGPLGMKGVNLVPCFKTVGMLANISAIKVSELSDKAKAVQAQKENDEWVSQIQLRVRDEAGAPVSNVTFQYMDLRRTANGSGGGHGSITPASNGEGVIALRLEEKQRPEQKEGQRRILQLKKASNGLIPDPVEMEIDWKGGPAEKTVTLRSGASISGQVLDHDGKPVSNVTVAALMAQDAQNMPEAFMGMTMLHQGIRARTDTQGFYEFSQLPPGKYLLGVPVDPQDDRKLGTLEILRLDLGFKQSLTQELRVKKDATAKLQPPAVTPPAVRPPTPPAVKPPPAAVKPPAPPAGEEF